MLPLLVSLLAAAQNPPKDAVALSGEEQVRELCAVLRDPGGESELDPAGLATARRAREASRAQALSRAYRLQTPASGFSFGQYRAEQQELELDGDRPLRALDGALSLDLEGIDDVAFRATPEQVKQWAAAKRNGKLSLIVWFRPTGQRCAGNAAAGIFRIEGRPLWWEIGGESGPLAAADDDGTPIEPRGVPARVKVQKVVIDAEPPGAGDGRDRLASAQAALDRCAQGARRRGSMVVTFSVEGGRLRDPQVVMDAARDEQTASCVAHALSGAEVAGASGLSGRGTASIAVQ